MIRCDANKDSGTGDRGRERDGKKETEGVKLKVNTSKFFRRGKISASAMSNYPLDGMSNGGEKVTDCLSEEYPFYTL